MRHVFSALRCMAVASLMLPASPALAAREGTIAEERAIARCIHRSALGRPWLEKTLWGLRDQEGGWIGAAVRNHDGSHDLGPFQINSWWVPRIAGQVSRAEKNVTYWLRFDPCFNAEAARWIYLMILRSGEPYWRAIGHYHSLNERRQERYAASVALRLRRRFGSRTFSAH